MLNKAYPEYRLLAVFRSGFNPSFLYGDLATVVNVIWHTRGSDVWLKPELHTYAGGGLSFNPDAAANGMAGLLFARANNADGAKASDDYFANGVNWTGSFWSAYMPIGEAEFAGGATFFTAREPGKP